MASSAEKEWRRRFTSEIFRAPSSNQKQSGRVPIFRVPERWKNTCKDNFEPNFLPLGLFSRLDPQDLEKSATRFKTVVVKGLLDHLQTVGKKTFRKKDWTTLCNYLVSDAKDMRRWYDLDGTEKTDDTLVRDMLAIDSIFLCGYLCAYLRHKAYPESLYVNIVSGRTRSFHEDVLNDVVKLENQVPLVLIERVIDKVSSSEQLHDICHDWVLLYSGSLPGFRQSVFDEIGVEEWNFRECKHLLGCLCRVVERTSTAKGWAHFFGCLCHGLERRSEANANLEGAEAHIVANADSSNAGRKGCAPMLERLCHVMESRGSTVDRRTTPNFKEISLPSASKLREKGIHFHGISRDTRNLVPIFKRRRLRFLAADLYIPAFSILQNTELVWRNMLAYMLDSNAPDHELEADLVASAPSSVTPSSSTAEITDPEVVAEVLQAVRKEEKRTIADFVCFMMFMDEMIDTKEDVALLRYGTHPVIQENKLGTNEAVAALLNTIARQQTTPSTAYGQEWNDLRRAIDKFVADRNRFRALKIIRHYFHEPWLIVSVVAAVTLLILAFLQTIYTIMSFYRGH